MCFSYPGLGKEGDVGLDSNSVYIIINNKAYSDSEEYLNVF